jgi:hypothetical protein
LVVTAGAIKFGGDVFIDTITSAAGHNLDFDGDITAATALTLNTGATTVVGNLSAGTLFNFAANGTLTFDGTVAQTITGDLTVTGTNGDGDITVSNTAVSCNLPIRLVLRVLELVR